MTDTTIVVAVPAQGPRGPKGDQGVKGDIGLRGIAGPIGQSGFGSKGDPGAGYNAASVNSLTLAASGSVVLTTNTNLAYSNGARVRLTPDGTSSYMEGTVTSYAADTGLMAVTMDLKVGAGTYSAWSINIAGNPGSLDGVTVGTMISQNADAVAIVGGTIAGMPSPAVGNAVATKTYVDDGDAAKAASAITISAAGLATGGGDLSANRTITVPVASQAEAQAGSDNTKAITPLRASQAITALQLIKAISSQAEAEAGTDNVKGMTALRVAQAIAISSGGAIATPIQFFTGNATVTIPTKATKCLVILQGAGSNGNTTYGGGSGATLFKLLTALVAGNTLALVVGAHALPGAATTLASGTQTISTLTAGGGGNGSNPIPGGVASGGDFQFNGHATVCPTFSAGAHFGGNSMFGQGGICNLGALNGSQSAASGYGAGGGINDLSTSTYVATDGCALIWWFN